jgi:hypothetical protein
MSDEQTILSCTWIFLGCLTGISFCLGAMWGAARTSRRLRTPRLVGLNLGDTLHR